MHAELEGKDQGEGMKQEREDKMLKIIDDKATELLFAASPLFAEHIDPTEQPCLSRPGSVWAYSNWLVSRTSRSAAVFVIVYLVMVRLVWNTNLLCLS